jgi:hypothetical protein
MKEFLEYDNTRPIVMECIVSSEHVYPMVPAGKALHEQIVSVLDISFNRSSGKKHGKMGCIGHPDGSHGVKGATLVESGAVCSW